MNKPYQQQLNSLEKRDISPVQGAQQTVQALGTIRRYRDVKQRVKTVVDSCQLVSRNRYACGCNGPMNSSIRIEPFPPQTLFEAHTSLSREAKVNPACCANGISWRREKNAIFFLAQDWGGDKALCATHIDYHSKYDAIAALHQRSTSPFCSALCVETSCSRDLECWDGLLALFL